MRYGHVVNGVTHFHEYDFNHEEETNCPGTGLDAATEAFNAFKLWTEKRDRLSSEELDAYDRLIGAHKRLVHIDYAEIETQVAEEMAARDEDANYFTDVAQRSGFSVSEEASKSILPHHTEDHHEFEANRRDWTICYKCGKLVGNPIHDY